MGSFAIATSQPIGILVADSNYLNRQLLADALRGRPEFKVSSCPVDLDKMITAVSTDRIDVALIKNDHESGTLHNFHLAHPHIPKVVLTEDLDREPVVNAFRAGARGVFHLTDASFSLLCKCIRRIYEGQIWASNEQLAYLLDALAQAPGLRVINSQGAKLLTPREEQVVTLVADGLPNRDIALELGLSENTIKKYVCCIFEKVGVSTRVELVLYAVTRGMAQQMARLQS